MNLERKWTPAVNNLTNPKTIKVNPASTFKSIVTSLKAGNGGKNLKKPSLKSIIEGTLRLGFTLSWPFFFAHVELHV